MCRDVSWGRLVLLLIHCTQLLHLDQHLVHSVRLDYLLVAQLMHCLKQGSSVAFGFLQLCVFLLVSLIHNHKCMLDAYVCCQVPKTFKYLFCDLRQIHLTFSCLVVTTIQQ